MSKGLEALNNLRCMTSLSQDCPYKESNDLCDIIEKELKALEIIKDRFVLVENGKLTQEEYELLREVLGNESNND